MNANTPHDANAVARDVDNTIDRALSVLRDAQPRSGLNGRILASLEHRTTEPRGFHLSARFVLWTAAGAAVIAVASMMILHHHAAPTGFANKSTPQVADPFARAKSSVSTQIASELPQTSIEPTHRMAHRSVTTSPAMPAACAQSDCRIHDVAPAVVNAAATTPSDAQLLADLHAPGHPAPPLPLTSEEKLFLHARRYGNLTQLAELNAEVRAKQDADETTAFKAFFPEPPPLKQPLGDTE